MTYVRTQQIKKLPVWLLFFCLFAPRRSARDNQKLEPHLFFHTLCLYINT